MTDLVLRDVRLVALDPGVPSEPVDVLVRGGVVAAVGPALEQPAGVAAYDGDGAWLMPGLWDQHVHLGQWAPTATRLDLSAARSVEEAVALVVGRLRERPDEPVIGWGHRSVSWPRPPTVTDLDAVAGPHPVVLICGDGHHGWLDSTALARLGLPHREGVVAESEWFAAYPRIAELTGGSGSSPADYLAAQQAAAALGVVGVVDLEFGQAPAAWGDRAAAGGALLRVRAGTYPETLDDYLAAGLHTGDRLPGGDPRLTMGPLKIISDGSLNTQTAWCHAPYGAGGGCGAPNLPADELRELLARAAASGLEVATHAIGDAAVATALDAYAATGARGSIEHAQLTAPEDLPRLAALGLRASVQPAHLYDDRDVTEQTWPDRADRCFMLRSMVDSGVELALGSDAPVAPLDPWLAVAAAVHRSADDRAPWHPEQAITPREALAASVDGQRVRPGAPADLVLLDADPLAGTGPGVTVSGAVTGEPGAEVSAEARAEVTAAQAAHLRSVGVLATWVAGTQVHPR